VRDRDSPTAAVSIDPRWAARAALLVTGIVVTGLLGQASAVTASKTSLIWLPTGIAAGLLFRWGLGLWPAVTIGIFLVEVLGHGAPATAAGVAVTGTLGTAATALLLHRFGLKPALDEPRDVVGLVAAAAAGMLVTASGGVFWLWLAGTIPAAAVPETWGVWWRGDFAGVMLAAPFVISASRDTLGRLGRWRTEVVLFVAAFAVTIWFVNVYSGMLGEPIGPVVFVIWAAMRFGILAGSLTVLACSLACAVAVAFGLGSFGSESATLFSLWAYMVAWALISLAISVIRAAGDRDRESLRASVQQLRDTTTELVAGRAEQEATIRSLERSEREAERASRVKTQFLANMSHELRTPVAAMLGFAEMLETSGGDASERATALEGIRRNGTHLLRLVDDVLDISKIESGRIDLFPEPCSPAGLVEDVMAATAGYAASRGVPLARRIDDTLPAACALDPTRMRQVLTNLVNNAIRFSDPGSPVTFHAGTDAAGRNLVFAVIDLGVGISAENQRKLFQPFSQVDESMTRRYGGTGLGLCLAARFVEAMGGAVAVESREGAGATFTVTVPVREPADHAPTTGRGEAAVKGGSSASASPQRGRVLLVEDSPEMRHILAYHLGQAGFGVDVAKDGRAGVAAAQDGHHDLILMDIQMPHMDGYEATRVLRAAGVATPIIALTAHASVVDRDLCRARGFTDYLAKPCSNRDLLDAIDRHLAAPTGG
jgi:signal transduction histidine kinase/CheY-like chemotaxis protein